MMDVSLMITLAGAFVSIAGFLISGVLVAKYVQKTVRDHHDRISGVEKGMSALGKSIARMEETLKHIGEDLRDLKSKHS